MSVQTLNTPSTYLSLIESIRARQSTNQKIVFVSGNFNVVHPGHIRLLSFAAEIGDCLVVGINPSGSDEVFIEENLRLKGVQALNLVDYAFILEGSSSGFIELLKPDIVVKGKEYTDLPNPEKKILDSYGGKLLFASGEVWFSHLDHLKNEIRKISFSRCKQQLDYLNRHSTNLTRLSNLVNAFSGLNITVIGDLIVDEYIFCDPLGMSQEDFTIVVTPIKRELFIGGAGIVAAHARALGGSVNYISVVGSDEMADFAQSKLSMYGVNHTLLVDESRPTTLKKRFKTKEKVLLRISELRQHNISSELEKSILTRLIDSIDCTDLVVFSDFGYGCLSASSIEAISKICRDHQIPMVADSQSSSQMGDIGRFGNMLFISPTEREARLALRDNNAGLGPLAGRLKQYTNAQHVCITLGSEGLLIHSPTLNQQEIHTDKLPAFNPHPQDISGAGDCLFIAASMSLIAGGTIWESAYIGSIAAACQVSRLGNLPLSQSELIRQLSN